MPVRVYTPEQKARRALEHKRWVAANRDKVHVIQKRWRDANRDKVSARQQRWAKANRDKVRAKDNLYYQRTKPPTIQFRKVQAAAGVLGGGA